eukprot:scaffold10003_cov117-Isochrysis_galbana.AAC.4
MRPRQPGLRNRRYRRAQYRGSGLATQMPHQRFEGRGHLLYRPSVRPVGHGRICVISHWSIALRWRQVWLRYRSLRPSREDGRRMRRRCLRCRLI